MNNFEHIIPFAFPVFFIGMWCSISYFLANMGGWTKLAEKFHFTEKFKGKYYRFQSGQLNLVSYSNSLEMGVDERGLFLVPMILFRLYHKPLLIPWGEIHAEPFKRLLFFNGYRLTFRSVPGVSLELYGGTFEKMVDYLKAKTGFQPNQQTAS